MNLSAITPDKPSLYYEHIKFNFISWILLQSPVKPPQFTKYLSSMHPKGHTQLWNRKCWVPLRSSLYLYLFWSDLCQYLSIKITMCLIEKTLIETVRFFKTTMLHPWTVTISNVKLKRVLRVYHVFYSVSTGKTLYPNANIQKNLRQNYVRSYIMFIWIQIF